MLVLSPITAKPNSGVIFSASSPDNSKAFVSDAIFFWNGVRNRRPTVSVAWLAVAHGGRDSADVVRGRPPPPADNIQPAVFHPRRKFGRKRFRSFRKPRRRKRIGQSCIR